MRKSIKFRVIGFILVALGILGITMNIFANDDDGKIILSKETTKVADNFGKDNPEYGRLANVTLKINANGYTEQESRMSKIDIILVLDSSNSMRRTASGDLTDDNSKRRITALKNTATEFVNDILDSDGNVNIGIVEYDDNIVQSIALTSNKTTLLNSINKLKYDDSTNLQAGIKEADELLDNGRSDAAKVVVILTDGIPTKFNHETAWNTYSCGNGSTDTVTNEDNSNCPNIKPSVAAKDALDDLKENHPTTDVWTITFGAEEAAATTLAVINPATAAGVSPVYKNLKALTADELEEEFSNLIDVARSIIGRNSTVVDIIPKEFKLTDDAKGSLAAQGATYVENGDGTTTITWNVGTIEAGVEKKLSYDVVAKNEYYGSIYTNLTDSYESAVLTTTVDNNNPYYKSESNKTLNLKFEAPVADIPAITIDDHYSKNASYVGVAESMITGTTILENDLNNNLLLDKENASQSIQITDEIVIDTNDNTVRIGESNQYQIKDGNKLLGILSMNADGTFTFVSEEEVEGEVSFNYHIKTIVVRDGKTTYLYSNSSVVTLNVVAREKINLSGEKVWKDNNNQDGIRPTSIIVELYANNVKIAEKIVTDNDWNYEFKDLYKYEVNHEGENDYVINYSIKEKTNVPGYTTSINNTTIINTHVPEVLDITGKKVWKDNNNQDGIRPNEIIVELYANGEKVDTITVTSENEWKYEFKDVPKYKEGKEIVYTVTEKNVEGYTTTISGTTITNTHIPEVIDITGKKVWKDNNNQDGLRPVSIIVELYADGEKVSEITTDETSGWLYKFKDVPKYKEGKEIVYTVTEKNVEGYTTTISGTTITNTHIPEVLDITGKKVWNDNNDQDGIRPNEIIVYLHANGSLVETITVTEETNWEFVFENVPKYKEGKEIVYTVTEKDVEGYTTTISGTTITNTHTPEIIDITVNKIWEDNNNHDGIRPNSITVKLLANGKEIKSMQLTSNSNWESEFKNLPKNENGKEIEYTIVEEEVSGYESSIDGYNITNTHKPELISISGIKTWEDNNDQDGIRPESITIRLLADGKEVKVKTVTGSNWTYEFKDLPKYNNGQLIKYTISEDEVNGYKTVINGYNVTNIHVPEITSVYVTKTWEDNNNQDGIRPSYITINLFANGEKVASQTIAGNWTYEFKELPKYNNGKEIKYTITEDEVRGYESSIDGYTITNTHTPETIDINGSKTWDDNNDQDGKRPESITINLLRDGKVIKTISVTEKNNWEYSFDNLDKYRDGGELIVYTISEESVEYYETIINGYNITNTHTPELISVSGVKTWDDNNNQDGVRPSSITVKLLANGKEVASKEVTNNNEWKYTFTNVPKYENGEVIEYTVSEVKVNDYTTKVNGMNITNIHTPEKIDISGTKTWDDNNDQDGVRPESITVNLLKDGVVIKTVNVTAENEWKYEFTDLERYSNGIEIKYTVSEEKVDNYTTKVNGYNITNTHNPEKIDISGTKTWDDNNDQDGVRPESIIVNLLKDGKIVKSKVVTDETGWTYTFDDLDKYRDGGELIVYTISEEAVDGYESTIEKYNITNTHKPGTIDVSGKKIWNDNDNQDGIRPVSITIYLLANGERIDSKVVSEESGWAYTFANLDEYKAGEKINYTVEEVNVAGYETTIDGYNITNTHTPELISVSGVKTWDDNDDQDGIRPESITVRLLANGEEVKSKVVTEDNEWKYTFTNVPKYADGKEITYTVTEDEVNGYVGTVEGMNITNKHTPITITINGEKVWVDENNVEGLRPESITVRLLADGKEVAYTEVTASNNWKYSFENVDQYSNGKEINYTVVEDEVEHYEMSIDKDNKFIIVNTHDPKDITVSGTKTWIDSENRYGRPESIEVTLTGKIGDKIVVEETKKVTEADEWKYIFNNLPEYREGIMVVYTIDEADVKDYTKEVNGFDITNTYTPETIDIAGVKTWDDNDNQDGIRPDSIIINLLANGEKVASTEVTEATNWSFEFKEQVVYANGKEITYTVEEISVDGYATAIEGFDVTNHHTPETVSYTVSKVWNDQENNDRIRPENITVRLLADGREVAVQVIDEASNWTYSFTDLAKYRDGGIAIKYEIVEDEVKGYTTTIEESVSENDTNITNVVITNTHENEKNEITINKTWKDGNDEYGKRPESITVTITGKVNDEIIVTEEVEITEDMDWTYVTNNHDKYLNGEEIIYEIEEKEVEGYETSYDGYNITNIIIVMEEIDPPHTDCDDSINSLELVNIMTIPETTKPFDIIAFIILAMSAIGISYNFKKVVQSKSLKALI